MSLQTELASKEPTLAAESQQVLLASRVEQVRSHLVELLLGNRQVANFIGRQLIADLRQGVDCSDIIVMKNSESYRTLLQMFMAASISQMTPSKPQLLTVGVAESEDDVTEYVVQDVKVVQLNSVADLTDTAYQLMHELHFLPVFLLDVAGKVEKDLALAGHPDASYINSVKKARLGLKALRQEMINSNTGLVAFVAHKYKTNCLSFDDLMQEGLVGLIKAVDRFDPERGICFSTYAIYWIRQAISRLIVKQDKVVPLPVALAEKSSAVFEAMRNCYLKYERWPNLAELKACCDLSEQDIKTISSYYQATHTLDSSDNEDEQDNMEVMANMQQSQFVQPLDELIEGDLVSYVDKAVATLPEKQATILAMRFGLKNHTEMTLQAVADQLNVTRERVRQIQNEALIKLKQQFGFDLMLFLEPNDS